MRRARSSAAAADERREQEKGFDLTPEEEQEILLSIAEAERGELIPLDEVLAQLRRR